MLDKRFRILEIKVCLFPDLDGFDKKLQQKLRSSDHNDRSFSAARSIS